MNDRLFWMRSPLPGNVGDLIGPFLHKQITGEEAQHGKPGTGVTLACGSIAHLAKKDDTVWTCGCSSSKDWPNPEATYLSCRGPLTHQRIVTAGGECPKVFGDAGLVVPRFLPVPKDRDADLWKIGIVPHYVDGEVVREMYGGMDGVVTISPLMPIEDFVEQLLCCATVWSSSLHGLILAHAYGIPCRWVRFSDAVRSGYFKYHDHMASVGLIGHKPLEHSGQRPMNLAEMLATIPDETPTFNAGAILKACPWRKA